MPSSNSEFLAGFFNLPGHGEDVAGMTSRPTSRQEQLERMSWRQRLGWTAIAAAIAAGSVFVVDKALDNLAERQSPPAGFDTDHSPALQEQLQNGDTITMDELNKAAE